jgi:hypothetical protein
VNGDGCGSVLARRRRRRQRRYQTTSAAASKVAATAPKAAPAMSLPYDVSLFELGLGVGAGVEGLRSLGVASGES